MSSQYFPPYRGHIADVKVKLDLTNYATKTDLKNVTHVDTSNFALKTNLACLKTEVDKLDMDKLVPVPNDLAKLSNVVKNDVVKKTEYNTLKIKVDSINTENYVLKTKYDNEVGNLKLKIPDISGLLQTSVSNSKITEVENKMPDITNLASKSALTVVENKIADVKNLVTKTKLSNEVKKLIITQKLVKFKIKFLVIQVD